MKVFCAVSLFHALFSQTNELSYISLTLFLAVRDMVLLAKLFSFQREQVPIPRRPHIPRHPHILPRHSGQCNVMFGRAVLDLKLARWIYTKRPFVILGRPPKTESCSLPFHPHRNNHNPFRTIGTIVRPIVAPPQLSINTTLLDDIYNV